MSGLSDLDLWKRIENYSLDQPGIILPSTFPAIEALEQDRQEMPYPSVHGRMIDGDAALGHHLFEIAQAQTVGEIPTNAE